MSLNKAKSAADSEEPPSTQGYPRDPDGGPYTNKMRSHIEYVQDVAEE